MDELNLEEYDVLRYLLYKVENHKQVLDLLFDVISKKYQGDPIKIAKATGYSTHSIRNKLCSYKYEYYQ